MTAADWEPTPPQPGSLDDCTACHACDTILTPDNVSVNADTCDDCLTHCGCWVCSETRWQIGEDRAEQAAFDAVREAS